MNYFLLFGIISLVSSIEYKKEDNVVILTDDSFDEYINSHDDVLVKFYVIY